MVLVEAESLLVSRNDYEQHCEQVKDPGHVIVLLKPLWMRSSIDRNIIGDVSGNSKYNLVSLVN